MIFTTLIFIGCTSYFGCSSINNSSYKVVDNTIITNIDKAKLGITV
ncbi:MAG: hypothetical protein H7098_01085 [Oligoflexus sp.]|nr:hypothetical protein [Pseudopedobacter sp.]